MIGGHDRAHPRQPLAHGREHDRGTEHALLEEPPRERLRQLLVAGDHRGDRRLARAGVEAERRAGPSLNAPVFAHSRAEPVGLVVDDRRAPRCRRRPRPAARSSRTGTGARGSGATRSGAPGPAMNPPSTPIAFESVPTWMSTRPWSPKWSTVPAPPVPSTPERVRVVDHHDRAVPLGDLDEVGQRSDVAVHREHAVGDQQLAAPRSCRLGRADGRRDPRPGGRRPRSRPATAAPRR